MVTAELIERRFAAEFAFWEMESYEDGWVVHLYVDGHEFALTIEDTTTTESLDGLIESVHETVGGFDFGEFPEGGLH
ncbi:MAG TPA: hypothetical protein VKA48_13020 [Gammaproteobacteria bacterium]|nr:hypothetical protein [Gammaproteobacteria bacterium]